MNELTLIEHQGIFVVDSREVAEMVDKEHKHLLRDIQGYAGAISTSPTLDSLNFFIPDTYQDSKGEWRPRYLITKKGCDMVANKMTGEKGVLFTAVYVTKFEQMEKGMFQPMTQTEMLLHAAQIMVEQEKKILAIETKVEEIEIQSAVAEEKAELAHKRIDGLDVADPDGTARQNLVKLVNRYAEKNGILYNSAWHAFRDGYNTAFHTNLKLSIRNYKSKNNIKKITIPEYLESVGRCEDAVRIMTKLLNPSQREFYVV